MAVGVRGELALAGVKPRVRARGMGVSQHGLLPCELTATMASGPHYRRAEWSVSMSSGARWRVKPPARVIRESPVGLYG